MNKKQSRYFIHSLAKGISMLTVLSRQTSPLSLSDVARLNQMNLPTASRYLRTLNDLGYIVLNSSKKEYMLTSKIMSLGLSFLTNIDLRTRVLPYMSNLSQEFGVTTQCAILDGIEIVFIERIRGNKGLVDLNLTVGSRLPAYCSSQGRAIIANLKLEETLNLIKRMDLQQRTPYTITNKRQLLLELEETRRRGYGQNIQELTLGYANFAAPVFKGREVEGAIGVSFPFNLYKNREFRESIITRIKKSAKEASIFNDV